VYVKFTTEPKKVRSNFCGYTVNEFASNKAFDCNGATLKEKKNNLKILISSPAYRPIQKFL
jgi:hypothetical protein